MTNKKYKYIFFDLFDTLIDFDYLRLPQISVDGEKHNSTSGLVYEVFNNYYPDISFDIFYKPLMETFHEVQEIKNNDADLIWYDIKNLNCDNHYFIMSFRFVSNQLKHV